MTKKDYPYVCPILSSDGAKIVPKSRKAKINKADNRVKFEKITKKDIARDLTARQSTVVKELDAGLSAVRAYPKSVTFFGSARTKQSDFYYKKARHLAQHCCREGFAVITGGGPGIMEAGNRGTNESCGTAVGFNIELPYEQVINPYVTHGVNFYYFFTRKVSLTFSAEAYVYFPGGFGTLDELFEILTLVQTGKIEKVPIILIGKKFWNPLQKFIEKVLRDEYKTISRGDEKLYTITDDVEAAMKIIKKAPIRET